MARAYRHTVFLSLAALLAAALPLQAAEPAVSSGQVAAQNLPAIVVTAVHEQALVDRVIVSGDVRAVHEVYVAPLIEGQSIRTINADVGDTVEAGAVLATLNDDALLLERSQLNATLAKAEASLSQLRAQLAEAKANSDEAERVRARSVKLSKSGSMSQATADQATASAIAASARVTSAEHAITVAEADIKVVEAQIADVDLKLVRTEVKAPVAGIIASKTAKVGAIAAGAGEPLFSMIRDGAIELEADVPESAILKLAVGQKAKIALAGGERTLGGSIRLVEPTIDPQTRLGTVLLSFDEPEKARVGMFASAEIITEEKTSTVLPLSAVTTSSEGSFVRKVEDGVVKMVKVETGIQDGQVIEIINGLAAGDEVVAKAGAYVRDGDRINPIRTGDSVASN
ncbi:efflux RND transporter periplasmic adaptor subunit [Rhizobium sp. TRM95111]|uniref:efflux RND transporter periplasmic adaptor subunit n=1 Tax=Rhizobium alarense TaxID=2846851 RepID=UPI001F1A42ED|nr:efflux RND transporter periplasmic adaptor subunit [Rhizobium alarense]MCF3641447.1 efflux RND transporter periplasmic adaptor subunit [Rhizobium alarense]